MGWLGWVMPSVSSDTSTKGRGAQDLVLPSAVHDEQPLLIPASGKPPKPHFAAGPSVPRVGHVPCAGAQMSSAVSLPPCSSPWCGLVQTSPGERAPGQALLDMVLPKAVLQQSL